MFADVSSEVFSKSSANLLLVVDSFGSETLERFPDLKVMNHGRKYTIQRTNYPQDSIASISTIATGTSPSTHGIVNSIWRSGAGKMVAYKSDAVPEVGSFSDAISTAFRGIVFSGSFDYQMASALGVHQFQYASNNPESAFGIYWNAQSNKMESLYATSSSPLLFTRSEFLSNIAKRDFASATTTLDGSALNVYLAAQNIRTVFDMNKKETFEFFAEIELLNVLVEVLKDNADLKAKVADSLPDLFSFAFSSLKGLKSKYGVDSHQFQASVYILDSTLYKVINEMSEMYNGRLSAEVVFMGVSPYTSLSQDKQRIKEVFSLVKNDVVSKESFEAYFPTIYLINPDKQEAICNKLKSALDSSNLKVHCPVHTGYYVESFYNKLADDSNGTTPTKSDAAASFQVILWSSIGLVLVIYAAVYALYNMDVGSDSLIYRMTSGKHVN